MWLNGYSSYLMKVTAALKILCAAFARIVVLKGAPHLSKQDPAFCSSKADDQPKYK